MVKKDIISVMKGGRMNQHVESVTLVNNTTLHIHKSVPVGKRWLLLATRIVNPDDVSRACEINIYKEVARTNKLRRLTYNAAVTTLANLQWPTYGTSFGATNYQAIVLLKENNTISSTWFTGGASAGGGPDADGLILEYLEYDM